MPASTTSTPRSAASTAAAAARRVALSAIELGDSAEKFRFEFRSVFGSV